MYFAWSNAARRELDIRLLRKAGVVSGPFIIQFLPDAVQERLVRLEHDYKGRAPEEIRRTRFRVIRSGGGFDFEVAQQEFLK